MQSFQSFVFNSPNLHIFTLKKKETWKFDYHSYEFL